MNVNRLYVILQFQAFFNAYKTEFTMPSFGSVNVPSKSNKNVVYTFQSPTHFTL